MAKKLQPLTSIYSIILFDGVCNLCNRAVNFVIRHDNNKQFCFVALQSELGSKVKKYFQISEQIDSVVVISEGQCYFESDAVLFVTRKLGFPWSLFYCCIIVPLGIRNSIYRWMAKKRYHWFGVYDGCRIPEDSEKEYFPDDLEL